MVTSCSWEQAAVSASHDLPQQKVSCFPAPAGKTAEPADPGSFLSRQVSQTSQQRPASSARAPCPPGPHGRHATYSPGPPPASASVRRGQPSLRESRVANLRHRPGRRGVPDLSSELTIPGGRASDGKRSFIHRCLSSTCCTPGSVQGSENALRMGRCSRAAPSNRNMTRATHVALSLKAHFA